MNITEIRVKLVGGQSDRVRAFCSVTLDEDFVIRDLKVIEGSHGLFVAMPSRKLSAPCPNCRGKNHMRARFCNNCGGKLNEDRVAQDAQGRKKLHADVAHPINADCRNALQEALVAAYNTEAQRADEPGYVPPSLDVEEDATEDDASGGSQFEDMVADLQQSMGTRRKNRGPRESVAADRTGECVEAAEPAAPAEAAEPAAPAEAAEPAESPAGEPDAGAGEHPAFADGIGESDQDEASSDHGKIPAEPDWLEETAPLNPREAATAHAPVESSESSCSDDAFGAGIV